MLFRSRAHHERVRPGDHAAQFLRGEPESDIHFVSGGAHLLQAALGKFFRHENPGHSAIVVPRALDSTVLYRLLTNGRTRMSHLFLSDEWIEAARGIRSRHESAVPPIPVAVRVNVVAVGVPFGEGTVHAHIDTSAGSLQMELGAIDSPDVTVTTDYETARTLFVEQDPASTMQAFMSGRIKVEGDISRIMMLQMSVPQDDRALEVAAEIRAITA